MIVVKITYGFFSQIIDTEKKELVAQNFIAGDQVDWEDENGDHIEIDEDLDFPFEI